MFCHLCGKETRELGLCIDCYLKKHPVTMKEVRLQTCSCGRFNYGPQTHNEIEKHLKKIVSDNLIHSPETTIKNIEVTPTYEEKKIKLRIEVTGTYKDTEFTVETEGTIKKENKPCVVCGRISSSYYEAVIQFRIPVNVKKVLDADYITRTEKVEGGFDAYITNTAYAKKIGKEFSQKGYTVKHSAKLVGRKEGSDLYRTFIAILSPGPETGDIIQHKNKKLHIIEFGKNIRTRDIETGKTAMIAPKELRTAEVIAKKDEIRKAIITSIKPGGIEIMDSENYQTYEIPTHIGNLKQKDEIKYIQIKNKTFIIK